MKTGKSSKQLQRMENKKKKIAAFLAVAKLNDLDKIQIKQDKEEGKKCLSNMMSGDGPEQKRARTDGIQDDELRTSETNYTTSTNTNLTPSGKVKLEGDEFKQLKEELKERKRKLKTIPRFMTTEVGSCASMKLNVDCRIPLFMNDIQNLIVYSQTAHTFYKPRWCHIEKTNRIIKTIVLIIDGISSQDYSDHKDLFSFYANFGHKFEYIAPSCYHGDFTEELNVVPLWPTKQKQLLSQFGSIDNVLRRHKTLKFKMLPALFPIKKCYDKNVEVANKEDKFPRTELLLSAQQMVEENYPVPLEGSLKHKYKHYIRTKDEYLEVSDNSPMLSVDCEMCVTQTGESELTRISIVDEQLQVIYDTLVKPYNDIKDYVTKYSGITKEMLDPVTVRLEDVQQKLKEILPKDAILIGQSLQFDLHALKMMHPYIIDTSVIFNISGIRTKKTKLMTLASYFLSEDIQKQLSGHCSIEDSLTCMKLVKLKLANSLEFGDAVLEIKTAAELFAEASKDESDANVIKYQLIEHKQLTTLLIPHIATSKKVGIIANEETVKSYLEDIENDQITKIIQSNNKQIIKECRNMLDEQDFILAHIKITDESYDIVNKWTKKLYKIIPACGLFTVLFTTDKASSNGVCFVHLNSQLPP